MAPPRGQVWEAMDSWDLTATVASEGLAIDYAGALAVAGIAEVVGVTWCKGAIGDRKSLVKKGRTKLRIKDGVTLAVGDPLILSSVAGQFDKLVGATGGRVFGVAREATTGAAGQVALCEFHSTSITVAAV